MGAKSALNKEEDVEADRQKSASAEPSAQNAEAEDFAAVSSDLKQNKSVAGSAFENKQSNPEQHISKAFDTAWRTDENSAAATQIPERKPQSASFKEKIQLAKQAQAESQRREKSSAEEELSEKNIPAKNIPIDAENIIRLPIRDDADIDYSDDEERLAAAVHTENAFPAFDLFAEHTVPDEQKEPIDWHEFLAYCEEHDFPSEYIPLMQGLKATLTKTHCFIKVSSGPQATIFTKVKGQLEQLLCEYLQHPVVIQSSIVAYELASDEELREKALNNPQIQMLMNEFGAEIYRCYDIKHGRKN